MTESQLQRAVIDYLRVALVRGLAFAIPNAARRTQWGRASNAVPGLMPGAPDVLVVTEGRPVFVELKTPKGRLSDAQVAAHAALKAAGATVLVCRSVEEVERALRDWGVPLKATTGRAP